MFEAPLPLVARNASKSNTLVPCQPYKNSPRGGCWLGWPIDKAATLTLLPPQHQLSERSGQTAGNRRLAGCSKDHVMAVEGRTTSSLSMAARCRQCVKGVCISMYARVPSSSLGLLPSIVHNTTQGFIRQNYIFLAFIL